MSTIIILLAQKINEATIEIFIFFAVVIILGFVFMRLYFKSIYKWRIKGIQFEKDNLKIQIKALNADNVSLYKNIQTQYAEKQQLTKKVNALKALLSDDLLDLVKKQLFQVNSKFLNRYN